MTHARLRQAGRHGTQLGKADGAGWQGASPTKNEPWVWLIHELLASPAWRHQSVNTARLIAERSERELVRAWDEQLEARP